MVPIPPRMRADQKSVGTETGNQRVRNCNSVPRPFSFATRIPDCPLGVEVGLALLPLE